jgi:hypothetical protein
VKEMNGVSAQILWSRWLARESMRDSVVSRRWRGAVDSMQLLSSGLLAEQRSQIRRNGISKERDRVGWEGMEMTRHGWLCSSVLMMPANDNGEAGGLRRFLTALRSRMRFSSEASIVWAGGGVLGYEFYFYVVQ